jgi:hypothetical protein
MARTPTRSRLGSAAGRPHPRELSERRHTGVAIRARPSASLSAVGPLSYRHIGAARLEGQYPEQEVHTRTHEKPAGDVSTRLQCSLLLHRLWLR